MSGSEAEPRLVDRARNTWRGITLSAMAVVGLIVATSLFLILSDANRQRDRALALQSHSYDVMILTRALSGTMARAEAALGRYVISGDQLLGRQYYEQWEDAGQQIDRLERMTADNPAQKRAIDRLRHAYRERGEELSVTALSTSYGRNRQAYARYFQVGSSPSLSRIDAELNAITDSERDLLTQRTGEAMASVKRSNAVAKVLALFGLLILAGAIALGWFTIRAAARAEAEDERERAAMLEEAVTAATSALHEQEAKLRQVQKMDAVGKLTGGIAHDFNNMLAVVLGGLELARRNLAGGPEITLRHIANAEEGAARAATLTRRLLAFSRDEALHPEALVPHVAIASMSDLLDRTLGDTIRVESRDDGSGWTIRADRHELENALLNLAVNARDAMDGRGTLTIATRGVSLRAGEVGQCVAGDYVAISVADTGAGMSPEVMERVFEPFFTTKPVGKGTGLGMSQIFAFARQSGGEVALASEPGIGTTVTLYLPRHVAEGTAAPERVRRSPAPPPAQPQHTPSTGELCVLLVEDDPRVRAATAGALGELGHHVVPCDNPLAAPAILTSQGPFDIVVSDVLMPEQTGPEMVATLIAERPNLAVLFVTGYAGEGAAVDFDGRPVLRKPFTIAGLERAIDQAMTFPRPDAPHSIAAE